MTASSVPPSLLEKIDQQGTLLFVGPRLAEAPPTSLPSTAEFLRLRLEAREQGDRPYTSASIATVTDRHLYGRFETVLKPARASGVSLCATSG